MPATRQCRRRRVDPTSSGAADPRPHDCTTGASSWARVYHGRHQRTERERGAARREPARKPALKRGTSPAAARATTPPREERRRDEEAERQRPGQQGGCARRRPPAVRRTRSRPDQAARGVSRSRTSPSGPGSRVHAQPQPSKGLVQRQWLALVVDDDRRVARTSSMIAVKGSGRQFRTSTWTSPLSVQMRGGIGHEAGVQRRAGSGFSRASRRPASRGITRRSRATLRWIRRNTRRRVRSPISVAPPSVSAAHAMMLLPGAAQFLTVPGLRVRHCCAPPLCVPRLASDPAAPPPRPTADGLSAPDPAYRPRRAPVRPSRIRPAAGAGPRSGDRSTQATRLAKPEYWRDLPGGHAGRARGQRWLLVAEGDAGLLGFVVGEVRDWNFGSPPCGWVFGINARPSARQGGVRNRLLDDLRRIPARRRARGAHLLARDNGLVMSFFRSQGMMAAVHRARKRALWRQAAPAMRLQRSTSIALCSLLAAASAPERQISVAEIAARFGSRRTTWRKCCASSCARGWSSSPGAGGGYRFAGNAPARSTT